MSTKEVSLSSILKNLEGESRATPKILGKRVPKEGFDDRVQLDEPEECGFVFGSQPESPGSFECCERNYSKRKKEDFPEAQGETITGQENELVANSMARSVANPGCIVEPFSETAPMVQVTGSSRPWLAFSNRPGDRATKPGPLRLRSHQKKS